jgi:putative ABC transport system permease protein
MMIAWLRRVANTLQTGRVRRDIDRELSFHVGERADALRAEGLDAAEALRQARVQFGNPSVQIERTRDVDVSRVLDMTLRNLRYAGRSLRRTPGFTLTVVLTLALGIGANTAVFSAIDAILLRPLPYTDADRLVRLQEVTTEGVERLSNLARLADWNRFNTTFEVISGYTVTDGTDATRDLPERMKSSAVAPGFFELLRATPALGAPFTDVDYRYGGPTPVLLSHNTWRTNHRSDPAVVGQTIRIRDVGGELLFPVAGVMPEPFFFIDREVARWSPLKADAPWFRDRHTRMSFVNAIGRLKPGITPEQARADLARVQAQLATQYPATDGNLTIRVTPLKDIVVGDTGRSLWLVFGAASLLLMIACSNIAALLVARHGRRHQEVAVRFALGGSRLAVAAEQFTETMLLATAGAVAGIGVASAASNGLRRLAPDLPRLDEMALDGRILLYTTTASITVALACGLLPALRSTRRDAMVAASATRASRRHRLQWLLVAVQVASSVTLLAGAALLLRSFDALSRIDTGFDASRVLAFRVYGTYGGARAPEQPTQLLQRINRTLDGLAAMPGIESVSSVSALPGVPDATTPESFRIAGENRDRAAFVAHPRFVAPSYFQTLGIPLVSGTLCERVDRAEQPWHLMINRSFAERYLRGRQPVGLTLMWAADAGPASAGRGSGSAGDLRGVIHGVVENARERGLEDSPGPMVYMCHSAPNPMPWHLVRTAGDPTALTAAVRLRMRELEPLRAVYDIGPLRARIDRVYTQNRLRTVLLTLFALTALSLAALGIYGTLSYVVDLRRREVGLRLALGARRGGILRQFAGEGLRVAAVGCACGLALALLLTRAISGMLFGISATDPATLSAVVILVLVVATLAALIPATRAALMQPMRTLREE